MDGPPTPAQTPSLVSVVVPTCGRPALLVDAVASVVAQTYERIELVVVDDGSDTAEAALHDLPLDALERTAVRSFETNKGANAARNAGVTAATGDLVAFLDDDDWWHPTKLARQVDALRSAAAGVAFVGQRVVVDDRVTAVRRPSSEGDFTEQLVAGASLGTFSTVLVRAEAFDRTGPLDERLPCWQDREWYYRLADHYDFVAVPEPLVGRRVGVDAHVSDRFEVLRDVAYPRVRAKHRTRARALGPEYERQFLATLSAGVGKAALRCGRYPDARRFMARSVRLDPTVPHRYAYLAAALGGRPVHRVARTGKRTLSRLRDAVESDQASGTHTVFPPGADELDGVVNAE